MPFLGLVFTKNCQQEQVFLPQNFLSSRNKTFQQRWESETNIECHQEKILS